MFFIHSSVSGHLSCFYILTIVSNAVINIGMHKYVLPCVSMSSDMYTQVELLGHMVVSFISF